MTSTRSMQFLVQEYLDERRSLGFALVIPGTQLMSFARFADGVGHRGPPNRQIIIDWARGQAKRATPLTWARRLQRIRPFAKYCAQFDANTEVPEADVFGPSSRRLAPHIYTDKEIAELLAAAGRLPPPDTLRPATYSTLFGIIAATGLRISEALHLRCADVDLADASLTVRKTKFSKSRLVPLHPTAAEALMQYATLRQQYLPASPEGRFFTLESGVGLIERTVHGVFERLRKQLGWTARGGHAMPRIHDLRHTFICRRVRLWHEQGTEIDNAMVALSTYVGHAKVSDTYWYLTGVPELMAVAGQRFEQFASNLENDHA
jgi:integrase/recombinase XerD